ncbi:MAG: hypothetical protein U9P00_13695 [Pseudomonadota bacterium]|nr:hypothetical protein [Pseudomonadota bacterium]
MASTSEETPATRTAGIKTGLLLLSLSVLSACGGGSSGGSGGTSSAGLDPLVEDFGIAYVRQPVPEIDPDVDPDMDPDDVREPTNFNEGSDLIFRDLASPGANERNVSFAVTGGLGDVKDLEASFDGSKLLFALRLPEIEGAAPEDQPTWNIWEYDIAADTLTRVITSDINAEAGQDVGPNYLPDGRIIFSSTRQRTAKATLLDESKPQFSALDENRNQPALVLHVMDDDGSDIHQVTYNQSHDLDPVVLENGEVVFSRWDNMGGNSAIHLYKMYPDGTNLRLLYGADSHDTGTNGTTVQYLQPRELPDGGIAALLKPFSGNFQGGDIISIDVDNYVNNNQPAAAVNAGILTGPAQASLAFNTVRTDAEPSPGGRFNAFFPLWDGTDRALVSWNQCRLLDNNRILPCTTETLNDPNLVEAPPLYGVYLYEMGSQTLIPVFTPQEGVLYRDVVAAQPRLLPAIHFDGAGIPNESFDFDPALVSKNVGILHIRSVHDFDGTYNALGAAAADITALADPQQTPAADRPARFLRIVKAVSIPDDDVLDLNGAAFGISAQQGMREIIGYAPIEPDGSVRVKVPADIPFTISVLDKDGRRISRRHQNWLQLRPGEILNCKGCHDPNSDVSHGRPGSFDALNTGAPGDGHIFPNTQSFEANTGETMAEARTRIADTALVLSADIHFEDVWTDTSPPASLPPATDIHYEHASLTTDSPASPQCQPWNIGCRVIINYQDHIHPLWNVTRDVGGVDKSCTSCHNNKDEAGADMEPAGQLDLSDGVSDIDPDHFKSYRELFSGDDAEILDAGGTLIKQQAMDQVTGDPLFALDANGDPDPLQPIFVRAPGPSMTVAGAIASSRFFSHFENPGDADHFGTLSGAELKLIAEWLDIGGQYYNNPFDVPP